jgi:hypothetical protein
MPASTTEPPAAPPAAPSAAPRTGRARRGKGWWVRRAVLAGLLLFALIQLVPYGHSHTNPAVTAEPRWSSPQTLALAKRACFDCHSNLTSWRWYSNVAPMSWSIQRDVSGGRAALNFTEWNRPQDGAGDVADAISGGSMPPWFYSIAHPGARLSKSEQAALISGLAATFRNSPPIGGG